jgi:hypothetical protein
MFGAEIGCQKALFFSQICSKVCFALLSLASRSQALRPREAKEAFVILRQNSQLTAWDAGAAHA